MKSVQGWSVKCGIITKLQHISVGSKWNTATVSICSDGGPQFTKEKIYIYISEYSTQTGHWTAVHIIIKLNYYFMQHLNAVKLGRVGNTTLHNSSFNVCHWTVQHSSNTLFWNTLIYACTACLQCCWHKVRIIWQIPTLYSHSQEQLHCYWFNVILLGSTFLSGDNGC